MLSFSVPTKCHTEVWLAKNPAFVQDKTALLPLTEMNGNFLVTFSPSIAPKIRSPRTHKRGHRRRTVSTMLLCSARNEVNKPVEDEGMEMTEIDSAAA